MELGAAELLADLGADISFQGVSQDGGCERTASVDTPDRLGRFLVASGLEYAAVNPLTLGADTKPIFVGESLTTVLAVTPASRGALGDIVVSGDSNIFTDLCDPGPTDARLWANLFAF